MDRPQLSYFRLESRWTISLHCYPFGAFLGVEAFRDLRNRVPIAVDSAGKAGGSAPLPWTRSRARFERDEAGQHVVFAARPDYICHSSSVIRYPQFVLVHTCISCIGIFQAHLLLLSMLPIIAASLHLEATGFSLFLFISARCCSFLLALTYWYSAYTASLPRRSSVSLVILWQQRMRYRPLLPVAVLRGDGSPGYL